MVSRLPRRLLPLLVVLGLGIGHEAEAERKVDWSDYLEPAGSRPPTPRAEAAPRVASTAPAKKKVTKRSKAESRAKATRKRPARGKARR